MKWLFKAYYKLKNNPTYLIITVFSLLFIIASKGLILLAAGVIAAGFYLIAAATTNTWTPWK